MENVSNAENINKIKSVLVVTGGEIDAEWLRDWYNLQDFDYVIVADSGLNTADKLGIRVDLLLGDYDSVDENVFEKYKNDANVKTYPRNKDYTDTHLAIMEAVALKPEKVYVVGATGSRIDHSLTNIFLLKSFLDSGSDVAIVNRDNKTYMRNEAFTIERSEQYGEYVSFLPVTEECVVTFSGMKYNLDNYRLVQGISLCQSNEIEADTAHIDVKSGVLLVTEARD